MYKFDVLELNDFEVTNVGSKSIYNLDDSKNYLSEIKNLTQYDNKITFPNMYGGLDVRYNSNHKFYDNALGFLVCEGDTVESNPSSVFILSAPSYRNRGVIVTKENFEMITSYFSARLSIKTNWKNQKDSYIFDKKQFYDNLIGDTIVYSLFNSSSHQSALKNINYKGENYRIKNNFFPIDKSVMLGLADKFGFDEMYNEVRTDENRYLFHLLNSYLEKTNGLSQESINLLEMFTNLVKSSFEIRILINDDDNHLSCWDAGFSQLKKLWKENFPKQYDSFRKEYKILDNKMEKRTYDLGFLIV